MYIYVYTHSNVKMFYDLHQIPGSLFSDEIRVGFTKEVYQR